ncbi:lysophospholipid acyltransferase family protein [Oscillospiraceae bacterium MB08-C2-2]|nr:lysophospholipid acyltransferase family protein [Oscillospiraceae bacterium MB08-C2-2]
MKYEGLENVPSDQGYILVSNHRSNYDPLFIVQKLKAQMHFMAKAELFRNPFFGWILRMVNAFPIERGKGDTGALEWATRITREGRILVMFPEGSRSKDGKLGRPRSGAAVIASQTGADILPCAVSFGSKLGFRSKVVVRYGPLIKNSELALDPQVPSSVKKASQMIMERIASLLD